MHVLRNLKTIHQNPNNWCRIEIEGNASLWYRNMPQMSMYWSCIDRIQARHQQCVSSEFNRDHKIQASHPSLLWKKAGRRNNSAGPLQAYLSIHFAAVVTHMLTINGMIFVEKSSGIKKHFDWFQLAGNPGVLTPLSSQKSGSRHRRISVSWSWPGLVT